MSLFGAPTDESPSLNHAALVTKSRASLFDDDDNGSLNRSTSDTLFNDDDDDRSPWDMPAHRRQQSRAELLRGLLAGVQVPDSYTDAFESVLAEDAQNGQDGPDAGPDRMVTPAGVARTLAAAKLGADHQVRIMNILAPSGAEGPLGRHEFNVLLALIALAQEGEPVSLDSVDERRRNLPEPQLSSSVQNSKVNNQNKTPNFLPDTAELAAKPPQRPDSPPSSNSPSQKPAMDSPEDDPWNTPDVHKHHGHVTSKTNGYRRTDAGVDGVVNSNLESGNHSRATSANFNTSAPTAPNSGSVPSTNPSWDYFGGGTNGAGGFGDPSQNHVPGANPFGSGGPSNGGAQGGRNPGDNQPTGHSRAVSSARTGGSVGENITVTLLPEKEGIFMFQHHNYEVASVRRGSKVIRRYSDFVWLLDCLHKRYPFRALPLLPPKRVGVNGNHLSNDGAFMEKRRRGLARFLNTAIRHPVLGQEQLVVMFLTVPTELSVWRKQATISVVDEFVDRQLPPGLEESLPATLEDLFERTRQGVKRSTDLYINTCSIMDRLVKRSEGVAADHARLAVSLTSLTETSADTYATDTNDVPLLNDGMVAMSKHLRTTQSLMEDESKAWDSGVLEDLKRQRDALVSVRDMFDRRERLDKNNIDYLQRRIQNNETKLQTLKTKQETLEAKSENLVKGEIEKVKAEMAKVADAIIKDKQSIVDQHNRSVFVRECIRDELIYFQQTQYQVSRWNQDWAQERVKYSEMLADNWRRLLDELEGMPLGD